MKKTFNILFSLSALIFLLISLSCKENNKIITKIIDKDKPIEITEYNENNIYHAYKDAYIAKINRNYKKLGEIYFEIGYYHFFKNKNDSAFYYFNQSKEQFLIENDSLNIGKSLLNMAFTQYNEGDFYGSEENAVNALKYFNPKKDENYMAQLYNCLAIAKNGKKEYKQAINYYNQSLLFPTDIPTKISIKNNQAVVYIKAKNYTNAINILSNITHDSILDNHPKLYATVNDNLAYAQWLNNHSYNAAPALYKTLEIRKKENDLLGQIANHSHLAEYYAFSNIPKAIFHAQEMYDIANVLKIPEDKIEALQKLISLENNQGTKTDFSKYLYLTDSLQIARNQAKNQFALIRYEVEKNKEENLKLKAENLKKNLQIFKQKVTVTVIIIITFFSIFIFVLWNKKRKEKFKREKIEIVQKTELKYSKKIHDEVANGIYHLMVQYENTPNIAPGKVIDELEKIYHKSRNISHESEFRSDLKNNFAHALKEMLHPYGGEDIKIIIIGNETSLWENLSIDKKEDVYHVLSELMTNMKKHSKANLVTLRFKKENNTIFIDYFDNGTGLKNKIWKFGTGLKNIENRINSLEGKFSINQKNEKGLSINISITI